jgi:integrase
VSPATGGEQWVVVDAGTYSLHPQATVYLASLRSRGCSTNTERAYAGRVALYLSYCQDERIDWAAPRFVELAGLQRWLVAEPLPARGRRPSLEPRFRSPGTANAVMTVVSGFLRFGAAHGWVTPETVALLSEPKQLFHLPPGYDPGETGQFRTVEAASFRFAFTDPGYQDLSSQQIAAMIALAGRARDRFLIALLACTGLRIGEALGLRREDLHLLASSRVLGCGTAGPHLHVRRRTDNPNGALAKSRRSRIVPVTADLVALYTDYQYERDTAGPAADGEMVFVCEVALMLRWLRAVGLRCCRWIGTGFGPAQSRAFRTADVNVQSRAGSSRKWSSQGRWRVVAVRCRPRRSDRRHCLPAGKQAGTPHRCSAQRGPPRGDAVRTTVYCRSGHGAAWPDRTASSGRPWTSCGLAVRFLTGSCLRSAAMTRRTRQ